MVITGLTRNQLYLTVPWVRIPPLPPKTRAFSPSFLLRFWNEVRLKAETQVHKHEIDKIRGRSPILMLVSAECRNSSAKERKIPEKIRDFVLSVNFRVFCPAKKIVYRYIIKISNPNKRLRGNIPLTSFIVRICALPAKHFLRNLLLS